MARAAGIGGGHANRRVRTPWTYFGVIVLIVALGVVGTVTARNRRLSQINGQGNTAPTVGTVWNEGYAVYECGKFAPAISHAKDPQGITTGNGDGIIHIHPTVKAAAGKNATLGKFASAVGMTLNAAALQVPGGKLYQEGDKCNGTPGHVYVKQFAYIHDKTGTLLQQDPRTILLSDQSLLTIAFVPASEKDKIPPPPSYVAANLQKLSAQSTTAPSTTVPPAPITTKPSSTTSTTVKK
ncbi:MAG: hypothetical protein ACRDYY_11700 [Acidimicrobiales bacterium]